MDEFSELLNSLAPKISNHPVRGFELNVANWLDRSGTLQKGFEEWRLTNHGQNQSSESQCRHLLMIWKEEVGGSNATFRKFKESIMGKPFTRQLIEDIDAKLNELNLKPNLL